MPNRHWISLLFLFSNQLYGQFSVSDTGINGADLKFAKELYFSERGGELALYNGVQREEYSINIKGHAYFETSDWQTGSVEYSQVLYENVKMRYDLLTDQVVVKLNGPGGIFFALFSPRTKGFSYSGLAFTRIEGNEINLMPTGFYLQLSIGNLVALEKRVKKIRERIVNGAYIQAFEESRYYYLLRNGIYYPIRKKKDILAATKDHKQDVQQFMSRNKLSFRKDPQKTIVAVAEFFNKSGF